MAAPHEYAGHGETCLGCTDVIRPGDMVVAMSDERPERLLCVSCWWLLECDLPVPAWGRGNRWPDSGR